MEQQQQQRETLAGVFDAWRDKFVLQENAVCQTFEALEVYFIDVIERGYTYAQNRLSEDELIAVAQALDIFRRIVPKNFLETDQPSVANAHAKLRTEINEAQSLDEVLEVLRGFLGSLDLHKEIVDKFLLAQTPDATPLSTAIARLLWIPEMAPIAQSAISQLGASPLECFFIALHRLLRYHVLIGELQTELRVLRLDDTVSGDPDAGNESDEKTRLLTLIEEFDRFSVPIILQYAVYAREAIRQEQSFNEAAGVLDWGYSLDRFGTPLVWPGRALTVPNRIHAWLTVEDNSLYAPHPSSEKVPVSVYLFNDVIVITSRVSGLVLASLPLPCIEICAGGTLVHARRTRVKLDPVEPGESRVRLIPSSWLKDGLNVPSLRIRCVREAKPVDPSDVVDLNRDPALVFPNTQGSMGAGPASGMFANSRDVMEGVSRGFIKVVGSPESSEVSGLDNLQLRTLADVGQFYATSLKLDFVQQPPLDFEPNELQPDYVDGASTTSRPSLSVSAEELAYADGAIFAITRTLRRHARSAAQESVRPLGPSVQFQLDRTLNLEDDLEDDTLDEEEDDDVDDISAAYLSYSDETANQDVTDLDHSLRDDFEETNVHGANDPLDQADEPKLYESDFEEYAEESRTGMPSETTGTGVAETPATKRNAEPGVLTEPPEELTQGLASSNELQTQGVHASPDKGAESPLHPGETSVANMTIDSVRKEELSQPTLAEAGSGSEELLRLEAGEEITAVPVLSGTQDASSRSDERPQLGGGSELQEVPGERAASDVAITKRPTSSVTDLKPLPWPLPPHYIGQEKVYDETPDPFTRSTFPAPSTEGQTETTTNKLDLPEEHSEDFTRTLAKFKQAVREHLEQQPPFQEEDPSTRSISNDRMQHAEQFPPEPALAQSTRLPHEEEEDKVTASKLAHQTEPTRVMNATLNATGQEYAARLLETSDKALMDSSGESKHDSQYGLSDISPRKEQATPPSLLMREADESAATAGSDSTPPAATAFDEAANRPIVPDSASRDIDYILNNLRRLSQQAQSSLLEPVVHSSLSEGSASGSLQIGDAKATLISSTTAYTSVESLPAAAYAGTAEPVTLATTAAQSSALERKRLDVEPQAPRRGSALELPTPISGPSEALSRFEQLVTASRRSSAVTADQPTGAVVSGAPAVIQPQEPSKVPLITDTAPASASVSASQTSVATPKQVERDELDDAFERTFQNAISTVRRVSQDLQIDLGKEMQQLQQAQPHGPTPTAEDVGVRVHVPAPPKPTHFAGQPQLVASPKSAASKASKPQSPASSLASPVSSFLRRSAEITKPATQLETAPPTSLGDKTTSVTMEGTVKHLAFGSMDTCKDASQSSAMMQLGPSQQSGERLTVGSPETPLNTSIQSSSQPDIVGSFRARAAMVVTGNSPLGGMASHEISTKEAAIQTDISSPSAAGLSTPLGDRYERLGGGLSASGASDSSESERVEEGAVTLSEDEMEVSPVSKFLATPTYTSKPRSCLHHSSSVTDGSSVLTSTNRFGEECTCLNGQICVCGKGWRGRSHRAPALTSPTNRRVCAFESSSCSCVSAAKSSSRVCKCCSQVCKARCKCTPTCTCKSASSSVATCRHSCTCRPGCRCRHACPCRTPGSSRRSVPTPDVDTECTCVCEYRRGYCMCGCGCQHCKRSLLLPGYVRPLHARTHGGAQPSLCLHHAIDVADRVLGEAPAPSSCVCANNCSLPGPCCIHMPPAASTSAIPPQVPATSGASVSSDANARIEDDKVLTAIKLLLEGTKSKKTKKAKKDQGALSLQGADDSSTAKSAALMAALLADQNRFMKDVAAKDPLQEFKDEEDMSQRAEQERKRLREELEREEQLRRAKERSELEEFLNSSAVTRAKAKADAHVHRRHTDESTSSDEGHHRHCHSRDDPIERIKAGLDAIGDQLTRISTHRRADPQITSSTEDTSSALEQYKKRLEIEFAAAEQVRKAQAIAEIERYKVSKEKEKLERAEEKRRRHRELRKAQIAEQKQQLADSERRAHKRREKEEKREKRKGERSHSSHGLESNIRSELERVHLHVPAALDILPGDTVLVVNPDAEKGKKTKKKRDEERHSSSHNDGGSADGCASRVLYKLRPEPRMSVATAHEKPTSAAPSADVLQPDPRSGSSRRKSSAVPQPTYEAGATNQQVVPPQGLSTQDPYHNAYGTSTSRRQSSIEGVIHPRAYQAVRERANLPRPSLTLGARLGNGVDTYEDGCHVMWLKPQGLGERLGLQLGDVIIYVNNRLTRNVNDYMWAMQAALDDIARGIEKTITFQVLRPANVSPVGDSGTVSSTLGETGEAQRLQIVVPEVYLYQEM